MADLKKVNSGDPLTIPARTYNAFVDAALDHQRRQMTPIVQTPSARGSAPVGGNLVLIRNDSGQNRQRFEILGINAPLFLPGDNLQSFQDQVALAGVAPSVTNHAQRFVITAEPIAIGRIGRAWISGVCPVQLQVTEETHAFAELFNNNAAMLKTASSGPVTILWKDIGVGSAPRWSLVRFGAASAAGLFPVKVWRDGGTTDGTKILQCNRTYKVRTATALNMNDNNAPLLGEHLIPFRRRPARGKLSTPPDFGAGVIGLGYYGPFGFVLYDANETLDVEAC